MQAVGSEAASAAGACNLKSWSYTSRLLAAHHSSFRGLFRDCSTTKGQRRHGLRGRLQLLLSSTTSLASTSGGPRRAATSAASVEQHTRASGGSGGKDPDDEPGSTTSSSYQIGLDPFSQQLIMSAVTAGVAWAVAGWSHLDLTSAFRLEADALSVSLQLSSPVLLVLLVVLAPQWAPPFKV